MQRRAERKQGAEKEKSRDEDRDGRQTVALRYGNKRCKPKGEKCEERDDLPRSYNEARLAAMCAHDRWCGRLSGTGEDRPEGEKATDDEKGGSTLFRTAARERGIKA